MSEENNELFQNAEPVNTVNEAPGEAAPKKKKEKKGSHLFTIILILVLIGGGAYYYFFMSYTPAIVVNDVEIRMSMTVKDLEAKGLCLCELNGTIIDSSKYTMPAETVQYKNYEVGVKDGNYAKLTGVTVYLMNRSKKSVTYSECTFYTMNYWNGKQNSQVKVTIDGQDFYNVNRKEAAELLKKTKMPIKASEIDGWGSGSDVSANGSRDPFTVSVTEESDGQILFSFKRNNLKIKFDNK
ncbi:MAG: hypothetical protein IKW95_06685 [Lachnospiraceae bacterium]|nr:hypothetical protein [Lachnospiraceae bacterium]